MVKVLSFLLRSAVFCLTHHSSLITSHLPRLLNYPSLHMDRMILTMIYVLTDDWYQSKEKQLLKGKVGRPTGISDSEVN